jgi:microcin C transport system ATP-binding protein
VFEQPSDPYTRKLLASRPQRAVLPLADDAPPLLQARDVRVVFRTPAGLFRHHELVAVDQAALSLRRGETIGIVGESGSGKTTLGMALLALQPLAGGTVEMQGARIDHASRAALQRIRGRLQVVFQDPFASLSPRLNIGQIVGEGLQLHFPDLSGADRERRVRDVLAEVGLADAEGQRDMLARYPHEFSGGQRQRIAIARVLALRPAVLVLDEPTSALDVSVQRQVLDLLARLQREHGLSYVFISHDLAVVRAMSHRMLVMKDGVVVESGESETLFREPRHPYTRQLLAAIV